MTKEFIENNILSCSINDEGRIYAGSLTRRYPDAPDFSDGAMLLAYEVLQGRYGVMPYRKELIYDAVQECVNYLYEKEE